MKKKIKEIINKSWGTGKCDIQFVLQEIEHSSYTFTKDEIIEVTQALLYKQGFASTPNKLAQLIFEISKIYKPKTILDICCGTGNILYNFKNCQIKGIDINPDVIIVARKLIPSCSFQIADSLKYNFGKEKFDFVTGCLPFGLQTPDKKPIEIELINKGLSLLSKNGAAAFVIPQSFLLLPYYSEFRKSLLSNHALDIIVTLPSRIFHPTVDIYTSLLIIRNGVPRNEIFMARFENDTKEITEGFKEHKGNFFLPLSKIEQRLDRDHYLNIDFIHEKLKGKDVKKLHELAKIIPGLSLARKSLKTSGKYAVFNRKDKSRKQLYTDDVSNPLAILKPNDIVIPLFGETNVYIHGTDKQEVVISSLYAILRSENSKYISTYLQSFDGQELLKQQAKRVAIGSTLSRINITGLSEITVPILPLSSLNFINDDILKDASIETLQKLELDLKHLLNEYESEPLHKNLTKEFLSIVLAQEERTKRIETQLNVVNTKLDTALNLLNKQVITIKNIKRNDDEKIDRLNFQIDKYLEDFIKHQPKNYSFYENEIKKWLDDWNQLDSLSINFLTSAEYLFDHLSPQENMDYSPFIIQYCRAFENELLKKIFEAYHLHLIRENLDRNALVFEDLNNEKTCSFAKFISKDRRDYTLGSMDILLGFLKVGGNTLKSSQLLQNFRLFVLQNFDEKVIEREFLQSINSVTSYRNKSAHPYILNHDMADACKTLIRQNLIKFLSYYQK